MSWHDVPGTVNTQINMSGKVRKKRNGKWYEATLFTKNGRLYFTCEKPNGKKTNKAIPVVLYEMKYGKTPRGMKVINKNGDYTDNRIDNLDLADIYEKKGSKVQRVLDHFAKYKFMWTLQYTKMRLELTRDEQVEILKKLIDGIKVKKIGKTGYEVLHEEESIVRILDVESISYSEFVNKILENILFDLGYDGEKAVFNLVRGCFQIAQGEHIITL